MVHKNVIEVPGLTSNDVILTAQPFSYMDPMWSLASAVAACGTLVVLDRFHPSTFWQSVADHGVTFFYCLGVMPRLMLRSPVVAAEQQHSVRIVCCSGIPANAHSELESRYNVPWLETYGMTEIGNGAAMRVDEAARHVGMGCIGRATSKRELRVVDEFGVTVERGTEGELLVRGVGLMDGYFDDEEATARAFRHGWFRTGDVVTMDHDGFITFRQRRKDMIRRSGENISAVEVERVIELHSDVLLAACVPVPDELRGEEIKAFVVLRPGAARHIVESELPEFCSELLAYFKVPRYWEVRDELPLTASSKVAKSELLASIEGTATSGWDRAAGVWQ
jgi:crotonobetaine/carnitine-CoA ligase